MEVNMKQVLIALLLFTTSAFANQGYVERYTYAKVGDQTAIIAGWNTWDTFIAFFGAGTRSEISRLEFDFYTPDYFIENNKGHFSVGIGYANAVGEGEGLFGHGLIIGNVTGYAPQWQRCRASPVPNNVVIESYFGLQNCVYGPDTYSQELSNNVWYHFELVVDNIAGTISYAVTERDSGVFVDRGFVQDIYFNNEHVDYPGWWIAEAFGNHNWVMILENVRWEL